MLLRILGGAMFIAVGAIIGSFMSNGLSGRVRLINAFLARIERIQTQIRYDKTPTKQLLESCAKAEDGSLKRFFEACLDNLSSGKNFCVSWETAADDCLTGTPLLPEDIAYIKSMGRILGTSDADGQISGLENIKQLLNQSLDDAAAMKETYGKMYRSLGLLGGIAVAVFII